jgi:threonyl-tRNA synthetase
VLSVSFNGKTVETSTPLEHDGDIHLFTWNDKKGKTAFWHSSAHVLAQTLLALYPNCKLTIGPAIENGFYYDADFGDHSITEQDLVTIEKKMLEFARQKSKFSMRSSSKSDALAHYQKENNPFKIELIENLEDGTITFCDHADFTDLCRGGHIPQTGAIKAVKLTNVAGAYWRGDETKKQLTRIYGISFPKQKELTEYLEKVEEAKKKRSPKIGKRTRSFYLFSKSRSGIAPLAT